ncbi:EAL domain-containing protein [Deinococcus apachensis]|uniref:EAL domain-containing protein n=1 Tax=Deinococcus apachensis TaxID=309886 RepID=UPI000365CEE3|nr:EAL domain-containing protein [Deinococcus apachensis]
MNLRREAREPTDRRPTSPPHPTVVQALLDAASQHRAAGDITLALHAARAAVGAEPDNDRAHVLLGTLLASCGENLEAHQHLDRAVTLRQIARSPQVHGARVNRAMVRLSLGDAEAAIQDLLLAETALRGTPWHAEVEGNLAYALLVGGDAERAEQVARRALDSRHDTNLRVHAAMLLNHGEALAQLGRHDEAIIAFREAAGCTDLDRWPGLHAIACAGLASQLRRREDFGAAGTQLQRGLEAGLRSRELRPQLEVRLECARLHLARGEFDAAAVDAEAATLLGMAAGGLDTLGQSELDLRVQAHELRAQALAAAGRWREAHAALQAARGEERAVSALRAQRQLSLAQAQVDLQEAQAARDRAEAEAQHKSEALAHLTTHDALTGLPNRAHFMQQLGTHLQRGRHSDHTAHLAVGILNLSRFRRVNDALGHSAGDRLLQAVAERLRCWQQPDEHLARMGGDEFLVMLPTGPGCVPVTERAQALIQALDEPFMIDGDPLKLRGSLGLTHWTNSTHTAEDLLRLADQGLYLAKRAGGGYRLWEGQQPDPGEGQGPGGMGLLSLERALTRSTLEGKGFTLLHQPIIDLQRGHVLGVESLLRWCTPGGMPVSPAVFVPVLEDSGLLDQVGRWVLLQAWQELEPFSTPDGTPLRVSVNVSPRQLHVHAGQSSIVDIVREGVALGLDPRRLTLELTESSLMQDAAHAARILGEVGDLGVRVAIDDFGTGYSSLSVLRDLPVHTLKIDRTFTADLAADSADPTRAGFVQVVHALANTLNLTTVIEGIERPEQARAAQALGIQAAQGWLYHRGGFLHELPQVLADTVAKMVRNP